MADTQYQSEPAQELLDWLQKTGKAQNEFLKGLGSAMGYLPGASDSGNEGSGGPRRTLEEIPGRLAQAQADILRLAGSMQARGVDKMSDIGQLAAMMLPNVCNWGAYKTTVGNNGRISIPEAERRALGLSDGDLVQVIVVPISRSKGAREVKQ